MKTEPIFSKLGKAITRINKSIYYLYNEIDTMIPYKAGDKVQIVYKNSKQLVVTEKFIYQGVVIKDNPVTELATIHGVVILNNYLQNGKLSKKPFYMGLNQIITIKLI